MVGIGTVHVFTAWLALGSGQARGWSQLELARRLDVSRQTVNAIETGRYDPSLPLAFRMADIFTLRIEEMFVPESL